MDIDIEFKELVKLEDANPGLIVEDRDIANPAEVYVQSESLEDFLKGYSQGNLQKLNRSRMAPARQETKPEQDDEQTCEEFFGCEKASRPGMVRLTKRLIPETNEVMVEAWDSQGRCTSTRFISVDAVDAGEPLAKASITSAMYKTLNALRSKLTPEEITLAEKAIKALDTPAFLEIIRGELYA